MTTSTRTPESLRSACWFAPDDFRSFGHRSRVMQIGYSDADTVGRPVMAIIHTWTPRRSRTTLAAKAGCLAATSSRQTRAIIFLETEFGAAAAEPDIF